jgi:hemerythrin
MDKIVWKNEYATGINVIDSQHKRIIDYINELLLAEMTNDLAKLGEVFYSLVDYTLLHFEFEESLMEDAGYVAINIHKQTHEVFRQKVLDCKQRYDKGSDVCKDLAKLLNIWLIDHIANEDQAYVACVKQYIHNANAGNNKNWLLDKLKEFFK